jgi:hypothetical protein
VNEQHDRGVRDPAAPVDVEDLPRVAAVGDAALDVDAGFRCCGEQRAVDVEDDVAVALDVGAPDGADLAERLAGGRRQV